MNLNYNYLFDNDYYIDFDYGHDYDADADSMSASPGFHFWLLSGSRAQQGYMRSSITDLWKFFGF